MKEFDKIYLGWRKGPGIPRHIVGVIDFPPAGEATFQYQIKEVEKARQQGFMPYTEFQNTEAVYSQNVLDIFAQRLTKSVRPDIKSYYDFWEIDPSKTEDKAYMLAHTQGLLATDNFEFLADYNPVQNLTFLTDLAHVIQQSLPADTLQKGDVLTWEKETQNEFDSYTVRASKSGMFVGYIKKIHCHLFHKPGGEEFKLRVKATEKNGTIKRIFATVSRESKD